MPELKAGLTARITERVTAEKLASHVGSGQADVFATPELICLLEKTAVKTLQGALPAGQTSVGTTINVKHLAPTPPGMSVTATATLITVNGRELIFEVVAQDEIELIAEGTHTRFIVNQVNFNQRAVGKLNAG